MSINPAATPRPAVFCWETSGLTVPTRTTPAPAAKPAEPKSFSWAQVHGPRSGKGPSYSQSRKQKAARDAAKRASST